MTAFGFRWYGPEDAVTLEHIRQIPPVTELVTSLYHIPAGALWPEEDIAAQAAQAAAAGLHFSVAEGLPVHESIKLGGPEAGAVHRTVRGKPGAAGSPWGAYRLL